jgi:hypothetical protein
LGESHGEENGEGIHVVVADLGVYKNIPGVGF